MHDCLNQLEGSRNFSADVLQAYLANKMISTQKEARKSNAMHVTVLLSSSNGEQYISCLLIVLPGIGLKRWPQCFNNLSGIFIHTYFCC